MRCYSTTAVSIIMTANHTLPYPGIIPKVCIERTVDRLDSGADPASNLRGSDFSNIWQSSLITGSLPWDRWSILHNTAVAKQWTAKSPYIANAVFRIVKNHGEKSDFLGFRGAIAPIAPLDPPMVRFHPSQVSTKCTHEFRVQCTCVWAVYLCQA